MRQRGFTLIELMVTCAIVAILSAMAMPNFSHWISDAQIRATADQLRDSVTRARQEALKRNVPVTLAVSAGVATMSVPAFGASPAVTITSFPFKSTVSAGSVTLNGSGRASANVNFQVTSPTATCKKDGGNATCYQLQVFVGGAVRMCDPAAATGEGRACL
jgi:prepilin-type N-terminal cleavage/methylation domain-containing protein